MSFNQQIIDEFRANGGKVGGPFEGGDLLLLTTTGARSGKQHTTPLGYVRYGGLLLVVGSAGGSPRHPAWYHNLLAHPLVQVEIGTDHYEAVAVPAEGPRRDRLFAHIVGVEPGYGDYQARTARTLPVVVLERAEVENPPSGGGGLADRFLEVHTWLRARLEHVRALAAAHLNTAQTGLTMEIRQHGLAFCEALRFHHDAEDAHLFPHLKAQYPDLRRQIEHFDDEHETVTRLHGELAAMLTAHRTADPAAFLAKAEHLAEELKTHLDGEEQVLLEPLAKFPLPS